DVFAGSYTVLAVLGEGPGSATYRVARGAEEEALRVVDPAFASPELEAALAQCRELTNRLPEEMALRVRAPALDPTTRAPSTAPERRDMPPLRDRAEGPRLGVREGVSLVCYIAKALNRAHALGLVHGALKPTNVFVGPGPEHAVRL